MQWINLTTEAQLDQLAEASQLAPVLIFKHSTRCSVSATALNRLERAWRPEEMGGVQPVLLDLFAHRAVSDRVAQKFGVAHASPQALLVSKGEVVYDASHLGISYAALKEQSLAAS